VTRSSKIGLVSVVGVLVAAVAAFRMAEDAHAAQTTNQPAPMEVKLERFGRDLALDIRLSSNLGKPIRVYQSSLPWAAWHSMVLVAVKANQNGHMLNRYTPIDDPSPTIVTLNPGAEMKGRIALNERFPDLSRTLREADVLVFWSYQLRPLDGAPLERQGGWLLIPKSGE
jgi:hypothetical protein